MPHLTRFLPAAPLLLGALLLTSCTSGSPDATAGLALTSTAAHAAGHDPAGTTAAGDLAGPVRSVTAAQHVPEGAELLLGTGELLGAVQAPPSVTGSPAPSWQVPSWQAPSSQRPSSQVPTWQVPSGRVPASAAPTGPPSSHPPTAAVAGGAVSAAPVVVVRPTPTPAPGAPSAEAPSPEVDPAAAVPVTDAAAPAPAAPATDAGPAPVVAGTVARTPLDYGAAGDGTTDDTAAVQRALDDLRAGDALYLPAGRTFAHSQILWVKQDGVTVTGGGTLRSTNPVASTLWVEGDDVTISGITLTSAATTRRSSWDDTKLLLKGTTGVTVQGVTVDGSASAGIFVDGSSDFALRDVVVEDTMADGIHITGDSHDGVVDRATVRRSGDDAIAVVSYKTDAEPVHDIRITSPRVESTVWGRGLSVVGGTRISYSDVFVQSSDAAALYFASESNWNTYAARDVTVSGGTLVDANKSATVDHGAILIFGGDAGQPVANIRISDVTIRDTNRRASREAGVLGSPSTGIELDRIAVLGGQRGLFVSNNAASSYVLQGWTKDGAAVADVRR